MRVTEGSGTPPFSESPALRNTYALGSECGRNFCLELAAEEKIMYHVHRWQQNSFLEGNCVHLGKCLAEWLEMEGGFLRPSERGERTGTWGGVRADKRRRRVGQEVLEAM